MLTATLNGNNIPLYAGFSFRMNWKNPACFFEEIPASSGTGIDIPVNQWSRMYFGNPERFEKYSTGSDRKFPGFEIRFDGVLLMSGTLNITSANQEKYSGWLQSEMGVLGEQQRDKNISEMQWDKEDRNFQNKQYYDDSTDDYAAYPVLNGAFWNGKGRETTVKHSWTDEDGEQHKVNDNITYLTERFRKNFARLINKYDNAGYIDTLGTNHDGEACVISPFLYLRPFLKLLFRINRFIIDRNDMIPSGGIDLCLEKFLLLYNNFNIMKQVFTTELQQIFTFDQDTKLEEDDFVLVITGVIWQLGQFRYAELVPHVPLKDILLGLQNYLNYIFVFKSFNKIDIIDRNKIVDAAATDIDRYFIGTWMLSDRKDVTLKFLNEFDKEDRMFSQEYHDYTDRRAEFGDPVQTREDLDNITNPQESELRLVKDENKIYEYRWKVLTQEDFLFRESQLDAMGWEFVSSGPQPYLYGEAVEIEEIKSCFSTLQYHTGFINLPVALQQGNLRKMKGSYIDFSPRLINSSEIFHPEGLNWDGENGLFRKRWERWARFWKNRIPVEGNFDLPLNMIYFIANNISGKYRTIHGEFIIETMETEIGLNLIGTTKITGYKI